jgi:uncharacterized membrane protein YkvA (DUF1232 family)
MKRERNASVGAEEDIIAVEAIGRFDRLAAEALRPGPDRAALNRALVRRRFWASVRDRAARLPFLHDLVAAWFAATDPQMPLQPRATLLAALAYFIMPLDAVPDLLPLIGFTDDAAVLIIALRTVRGQMLAEHWARASDLLLAHRSGRTSLKEVAAGPVIDHADV